MDYLGYKVTEGSNMVAVEDVTDFDPVHTFECGQCFRWVREPDGSHTGVASGRVINVKYRDCRLEIYNTTAGDFKDIWFDYLDLGRDYSQIKKLLMKDDIMERAIAFGHGIRLLRQELRETLISFIFSINNRIPMIMKEISLLSKLYGNEIEFNGSSYYAFPDMDKLSCLSVEQLGICRAGFRCKYISNTSRLVKEGVVDLDRLQGMDTPEARDALTKLPGVGNKVADCTLLYSGTKHDVFPTDVWVKRVMEELYFKRKASFGEIQDFAGEYFGSLAGFAQQYLFYYARENRIGTR